MSFAYEVFLTQFNAVGSEKADGYSKKMFEPLNQEEKKRAYSLLLNELPASPYNAEWLIFLQPSQGVLDCENAAEKMKSDPTSGVFIVYYYLWEYTKQEHYIDQIIDLYAKVISRHQKLIIRLLGKIPLEKSFSFLKKIFLLTEDEANIGDLATSFLNFFSIEKTEPHQREEYRNLITSLKKTSASYEERQRKINLIEDRYGKPIFV